MAKEKTKDMTKTKKIVNITILVLQILIIIACIAFSIVMVVSSKGNQEGKLRKGVNLMPVMSNSMDGDQKDSFTINDLVFIKRFESKEEKVEVIKEGQIVSFKQFLPDAKAIVYVTHRVVHVVTDEERAAYAAENKGASIGYDFITQGDLAKELNSDAKEYKNYGDAEGYYTGQIKGLGGVITFLKKPEAFFPLIVVPLVLLLLYNAYVIIKAALDARLIKLNAEKDEQTKQAVAAALAAAGFAMPTEEIEEAKVPVEEVSAEVSTKKEELDVDEIKKKAVEEYIKQQAIEEYKLEQEKLAKQAKEKDEKEDK